MKRLVLLDSHALIHRAFHALPPLTTPAGEPIGAVYGFTTILLRMIRELKPDYIVAAFDLPGPTFRHVAYERYKAQRPETASELISQFSKVREVLDVFQIPRYEKPGYEADDIIGTIVEQMKKKKDVEVIIVTGDMDALQLVRPGVKVYTMKKGMGDIIMYDEKEVHNRFGLTPEQIIDYKGLKGDPSDNIPGVKGIGEKTATELLTAFGSVEGIYKALKKGDTKISASVRAKLEAGEEDATFSKELATIRRDVPIEFDLKETELTPFESTFAGARELFQKFGFTTLLKRLEVEGENPATHSEKKENEDVFATPKKEVRVMPIVSPSDWGSFEDEARGKEVAVTAEEGRLFLVVKGGGIVTCDEGNAPWKVMADFFKKNTLIAHDAKSVIRMLQKNGISQFRCGFDTMIAAYLTQAFSRNFSYQMVAGRELGRLVEGSITEELIHIFDIAESLRAKISAGNFEHIFNDIEMPLVQILADMEARGILIDSKFLRDLGKKINKELDVLTKDIYTLAGEEFNIKSTKQLSVILFEKLHIDTGGLRKTEKGGVVSTGASELEKLKDSHPIIPKVSHYRELMKLKNTYVDVLPDLAHTNTGRLHTVFNQAGAATGRLSSSDPNLQNIPIMSEYGKEVRKAFIADPGYQLVSFDYSQIELRVAAHMADDEKMIQAFKDGMDIHKMTASEVYNVPLEKVTADLRRAAKTLNFGVLYGMGAHAFAEATGMSRADAKKFIDEYFHDFSGIKAFMDRTKQLVAEQGYVETISGRRRYIPEALSSNWQLKREADRMAVNAPIQGSAADIVKMAMVAVDGWVKKEKTEKEVRLLLQIHDELLFEIKKEKIEKVAPVLRGLMEGVMVLKVPLVVDVKAGENWGEQKTI